MKAKRHLVFWGIAIALTGCAAGQDQGEDSMVEDLDQAAGALAATHAGTAEGGIVLQADVTALAADDVAAIRYDIAPCGCATDAERITAVEPLHTGTLPSSIPSFQDNPLDSGSAHELADHFQVLPPGCYDVTATPLQEDGYSSLLCAAATRKGIQVFEGETTEIFMINQCSGPTPGAIDVPATPNHPPELPDVELDKFVHKYGQAFVCATAFDVDGDPLLFRWRETNNQPLAVSIVSYERQGAFARECVLITPGDVIGDYNVQVSVYDLVWDSGSLMTIEDWLSKYEQRRKSHTALRFPIHVGL